MKPHPLIAQLVEERRALDLTQREAAAEAGIFQNTLSTLETGARTPSLPTLEAYAEALGFVVTLVHVGEKHCRGCNTTKRIRYFGHDRHTPDGLATRCGACAAASAAPRSTADPDARALERQCAPLAEQSARITEEYTRRLREYANLRAQGLSVPQAAKELGITRRTGWRYEAKLNEQVAA